MKSCIVVAYVAVLLSAVLGATNAEAQGVQFRVKFSPEVQATPFTGRLYVMSGPVQQRREPRLGPDWFQPSPFFAKDVKDLAPDAPTVFGADCLAFPGPISTMRPGRYAFQAVLDLNQGHRDFSNAEGNGYSKIVEADFNPQNPMIVNFYINEIVKPEASKPSDRMRVVELPSPLISQFTGRDVKLQATVALPASYAEAVDRRYPVYYSIPGFGGTHRVGRFNATPTRNDGEDFIIVHLNPECPLGHHVFADSANNGPYGQALVEELIPHIEKTYRAVSQPWARYVGGHSSGGWSSLWLQIAYPDFFGGVWSTSPDPVDFRDFQRINLYAPQPNMFKDEQGSLRPIARQGEKPIIFYKQFSDMEIVMGHGGQLGSFEAVFSPRLPSGLPQPLWNRQTGAVDPATAKAWEKYDIRLKLEREWPTIGPKLKGKLHCYMGGLDTFYLEGAVKLLQESLARLGSDAKVEVFPGLDHGTVLSFALRQRIAKEMADQFRKGKQASEQNGSDHKKPTLPISSPPTD